MGVGAVSRVVGMKEPEYVGFKGWECVTRLGIRMEVLLEKLLQQGRRGGAHASAIGVIAIAHAVLDDDAGGCVWVCINVRVSFCR